MSIDPTAIARAIRPALLLALLPVLLTAEPGLSLPTLRFEASFDLHHRNDGLTEPSALSFDPGTGTLWTVSDDTDAVFRIDQQGRILSILKVPTGLRDPEAVAHDPAQNRILVLSEKDAAIIAIDLDDPHKQTAYPILEMAGRNALRALLDDYDAPLSPEGMAIDTETGRVLVVNESLPRVLLQISADLDRIETIDLLSADAGYAVPGLDDDRLDAAGLAVDPGRDALWIVSDTGKSLFFYDRTRKQARRFTLLWRDGGKTRPVSNAEGIALDRDGRKLFVASDDGHDSRLFVYRVE
jgi:uncharacterized protein YjiK